MATEVNFTGTLPFLAVERIFYFVSNNYWGFFELFTLRSVSKEWNGYLCTLKPLSYRKIYFLATVNGDNEFVERFRKACPFKGYDSEVYALIVNKEYERALDLANNIVLSHPGWDDVLIAACCKKFLPIIILAINNGANVQPALRFIEKHRNSKSFQHIKTYLLRPQDHSNRIKFRMGHRITQLLKTKYTSLSAQQRRKVLEVVLETKERDKIPRENFNTINAIEQTIVWLNFFPVFWEDEIKH